MLSHRMYQQPMPLKFTPYRPCGWGSVDSCCGDVMRRPTFCHNSVAAVEATHNQAPHQPAQGANIDKEETRLARMKRIFTGTLLMGRRPQAAGGGPPLKTFAVHLDDQPLTNEGLPRVLVRITTFIEKYGLQMEGLFRLSGGNPKLVEQLKASLDRTGDADLEGCGDVTSVAALLKLWLRDLPEPVVPAVTAAELVSLLQKYKGDTDEWCVETGRLLSCGNGVLRERNARLLRCVLRLLHRYQLQQQQQPQQLAPVFAALLLSVDDSMPRIASPDTTAVMYALITNYGRVYDESITCGDMKMDGGASTPETRLYSATAAGKNKGGLNAPAQNNMSETTPLAYSGSKKQRKRKDRQSSADRKFVRSNSEERPCKSSCGGGGSLSVVGGAGSGGGGGLRGDTIRRVSSHEDFSRSRTGQRSHHQGAQLMELISETAACIQMSTPVTSARPLHERNQQFAAIRSVSTNSNSNSTTKNNNNNLNLNLNKVSAQQQPPSSAVVEYNNNNNEPLPWQPSEVRRDESLAVSVVCSPPPSSADCQLIGGAGAADEEEEREHERRRSSERFAPCGGGVMMMGRRRGENGGERRRKKVVSRGGGTSTPSRSHRRHARSPRRTGGGCSTDTSSQEGGDSSSKENEEQEPGAPRRCSTLMVVSPPSPRRPHAPLPPLAQAASFSGGEEAVAEVEAGGEETPGSLSRSSTEEESETSEELLNEPLHDPLHSDEHEDEKVGAEESKEEEEEVKGDVEELEDEDEDEEEEEEGEGVGEEEDLNNDEPVLDLNSLHRNVDESEPVPSRHDWSFAPQLPQPQQERLDGSLRNSATFAAGHRAFEAAQAVSAVAAATPPDQLPLSGRTHISVIEHHHAKQIHTLKKRLKRYEEGFEREFGYKPSSADKMANPDTKKMCLTLSKLRRELKQLKSESTLCPSTSMSQLLFLASGDRVSVASAGGNGGASATKVIKEDIVHDVEKRLNDKRQTARRPTVLEEMSREQLADEKTAVQRALLQLEAVYGRPATRDQRDLVRPLYERYRQLKRLLARATANAKLKEGVAELGTILEHEQMDFSSSSPPPPSAPIAASATASVVPPPVAAPIAASTAAAAPNARPTTPDYFENLHALPRNELLDQHKTTREEKKRLRRQLHEFEDEMESKMGRKLQREDRQPMDAVYTQYKHVKAKLRLIEALITKK